MKSKNYDSILIDHLQKAYKIAPKSYKKSIGCILMRYTFPSLSKRLKFKIVAFYIFKILGLVLVFTFLAFGLVLLIGSLAV